MTRPFDITGNDNTLYTTGRCNNRCIFCCEPPVNHEDAEELWARNMQIIDEAPAGITAIGVSGGEPSLLGERLVELVDIVAGRFPQTVIHLLTNGRAFSDAAFARRVAEAARGRLLAGVPLHSDYATDHDLIAGARGAYAHTVAGICNLAAAGAAVELRVVVNRLNHQRLGDIALFVHRNLSFVALTAFMAMERIGMAAGNARQVWVEPAQYAAALARAVSFLDAWGHPVAVYNVPMCLLRPETRRFACRSISDWKQSYAPGCAACELRQQCCGLFATSTVPFENIRAICSTT